MPDLAVRTSFTAVDQISAAFKKMGKSADKFGYKSSSAFSKASGAAGNLLSSMKSFAVLGVTAGIGMIAKEILDFDHAIVSASAKFPGLNKDTKEGQELIAQLGATAKKIGADTEHSMTAAAEGLNFLAMAGFDARQAMALLPGVTDLATAADLDFARASDIASDALGSFGLMTKDTEQLSKNFTRVQDVMAKTVTSTNTDMESLFETIKFGAAPFTSAGQSMETFSAIAGRMASNAIKGSNAGTALRSMITRLEKPTKEVEKGLAQFGLTQADIIKDGQLMDMVEILKLFEKGSTDLTKVQRNAALGAIAGKNAYSAWAAVMNEGVSESENLKKTLADSAGAASQMAAVMRSSLINQLKILMSTVISLGDSFASGFMDKGAGAIKALVSAAQSLRPVFKAAGDIFSEIIDMMPTIITWFVAYKAALAGITIVQKAQMALGFIKSLWKIRHAYLALIKTQGILNVIMSLNPVGLVIIGITALIALVITMIRKWNEWGSALSLLLGPIGLIINVVKSLYDNWGLVKKAFQSGGILAGLKMIGKAIISGLLLPVEQLLGLIAKIPGVGKYAAAGMQSLKSFRADLMTDPTAQKSQLPENYDDILGGIAPNESLLKAQQVRLTGDININGAPEGSTADFKTNKRGSQINPKLVGQNL